MYKEDIAEAAEIIKNAEHLVIFTGAGISVESGIPPFRGPEGLWSKVNPEFIDLDVFKANPAYSWAKIKEIFYDFMGEAKPNLAHKTIAEMEDIGLVKSVITQNIDHLHQDAGSKNVLEFHGTTASVSCLNCDYTISAKDLDFSHKIPTCPKCGGLLKPDFIFFSEMINPIIMDKSFDEANKADVMLVVGTSGDVMPACHVPVRCKFPNHGVGGTIIEINLSESSLTNSVSDYLLKGKATEIFDKLGKLIL